MTKVLLDINGPRPKPGDKYHLAAMLENPNNKIKITYLDDEA